MIVSTCTDKQVTIFEAATGNQVCKTTCGELTTSLGITPNLKHLVTASSEGIIFVWKLPDSLQRALTKLKNDRKLKANL